MKRIKNKKIVFWILVVILIFFIGNVETANAEVGVLSGLFGIGSIASAAIGMVVYAIGYILGVISSAVFWLAGLLVDFSFEINSDILSSENAIVHSGWNIVLSFTNLGFVLAIIIIAFATILRRESYGMNQILWKLIVAALLVNFSLVIAGAFISVSDIVSKIFLDKATLQGPGSFSVVLGNALGVQTFLDVSESADSLGGAVNVFGSSLLALITSILFIAVFNFVGGLTLLALAVMLLIRYVTLSILLIVSPIVWLLWIFPFTQKYWKEWWDNFMRWTFFAPIVLFFLYLTVSTLAGIKDFSKVITASNAVQSVAGASNFTFGVDTVGKFVTVIGLMLGGLIAANKMSITGASAFYGAAQGGSKAIAGWYGRKGVRAAGWAFRPPKTKIDPITGAPYSPTTGPRAKIQRTLYNWQTAGGVKGWIAKQGSALGQAYGRPGQPHKIEKNFFDSVWGGMKGGSGLFKKKKQKFKVMTEKGEMTLEGEPVAEKKKEEKKEEKKI